MKNKEKCKVCFGQRDKNIRVQRKEDVHRVKGVWGENAGTKNKENTPKKGLHERYRQKE